MPRQLGDLVDFFTLSGTGFRTPRPQRLRYFSCILALTCFETLGTGLQTQSRLVFILQTERCSGA